MAIADKLTKLSTDITNAYEAIEDKGGTIPANKNTDNLEDAIRSISSGHLDNTEYQEAIDDLDEILEGSTPTKVYPPDWSQIGYEDTPQSIIDDFNYAKEIYDNWDNNTTSMLDMFKGERGIAICPKIDTSNVTNMNSAFYGSQIAIVPILDTKNVTAIYNTFAYCSYLTKLSLNNILAMCAKATSYKGTKTLKNVGLSKTQTITCQSLSNYQAFLDAGWTTGY